MSGCWYSVDQSKYAYSCHCSIDGRSSGFDTSGEFLKRRSASLVYFGPAITAAEIKSLRFLWNEEGEMWSSGFGQVQTRDGSFRGL